MGRKRENQIYNYYNYDDDTRTSTCILENCRQVLRAEPLVFIESGASDTQDRPDPSSSGISKKKEEDPLFKPVEKVAKQQLNKIKHEECHAFAQNVAQQQCTRRSKTSETEETPVTTRNRNKDPLVRAVEALENVASKQLLNTIHSDEFELFGRTIAQQLRQLPLEAALETEEMVLAVIRKQRVKIANAQLLRESSPDNSEIMVKMDDDSGSNL